MSSITLPSQSFPPAPWLAHGIAARALVAAVNGLAALPRSALAAAASRLRTLRRSAQAAALRERALARLNTAPGYAAELLAAASLLEAPDRPA